METKLNSEGISFVCGGNVLRSRLAPEGWLLIDPKTDRVLGTYVCLCVAKLAARMIFDNIKEYQNKVAG